MGCHEAITGDIRLGVGRRTCSSARSPIWAGTVWWRTREPAGSMPAITPRTLRRFREMKSEAGGVPSNISFELTARALGALSDEENRGVQTRISKSTATDDLRRWWHS